MLDQEAMEELRQLRWDIRTAALACRLACRRKLERHCYLILDYAAAPQQIEHVRCCGQCDGAVIAALEAFVKAVEARGTDNVIAAELTQVVSQGNTNGQ